MPIRPCDLDNISDEEYTIEIYKDELLSLGEAWDETSAYEEAKRMWDKEQLEHLAHV